ncbi:outer membrane protein/protective antigen OMA87 [Rivularia sp. PCC 7116]|uniref:BamA/TamA family outer membrane protein n=1 Tax=Rivularia sp. PCC 7116 TaxID=373994 RepID=UPI00029F00AE|nr:BamA/TamA family outer membrane protein [Rivularia sp. PCC 7116]AFY58170.1 outer membrane protein/protective antigen OMA87 [Rivularia sp. PCC 7116]
MRISSAAIFTLAALAATNIDNKATAANDSTPLSEEQKAENIVVPVIEDTPAPEQAIAQPETLPVQQFSSVSSVSDSVSRGDMQLSVNSKQLPVNSKGVESQKQENIKQKQIVIKNSPAPLRSPSPTPPLPPSGTPVKPKSDFVVPATNVQIVGVSPELQQVIKGVIKTQPGADTSQTQLKQDVAAISETGLFAGATVNSRSNEQGLSVVFQAKPVVVRSLQLSNAKALSYQVAQKVFQSQIGKPISPVAMKKAVEDINKWYTENNYSLARVTSIKPNSQGVLDINVAEGLIGNIKFRFINDDNKTVDKKGKPIEGRTKPEFITKQIQVKSGQIFKENRVRQDVQRLYATGLFERVNLELEGDANKVDVVYYIKEAGARSVNVGGNYSADQGIVGTLNYNDRNVGGINENLNVNLQLSRRDLNFDTRFTSPYRANNPNRLGYSLNAFRKRQLSNTFNDDIKLANDDKVREGKFGGSVTLQRPIDGWNTTLGFNYTRVSITDSKGKVQAVDAQNNPLTKSGTGIDDLATVSLNAVKDRRNNPFNPTKGSVVKLSTEQSLPFGQGEISMNRLKADYTQYVPVKLFKSSQTQVFALNVQAGTVLGDLPPYESFGLGGSNSVRGYGAGDVGNGRSYVLASAEYRFPMPILDSLGGVLFADFATDLGSGDTVVGDPAGVRNKPGEGFGYGAGVRLNSPLGLIRADYGVNNQGDTRVHFGIGHRF